MKRWNKNHISIVRERIEVYVLRNIISAQAKRCYKAWCWEFIATHAMLQGDCSNRQSYFILVAETP